MLRNDASSHQGDDKKNNRDQRGPATDHNHSKRPPRDRRQRGKGGAAPPPSDSLGEPNAQVLLIPAASTTTGTPQRQPPPQYDPCYAAGPDGGGPSREPQRERRGNRGHKARPIGGANTSDGSKPGDLRGMNREEGTAGKHRSPDERGQYGEGERQAVELRAGGPKGREATGEPSARTPAKGRTRRGRGRRHSTASDAEGGKKDDDTGRTESPTGSGLEQGRSIGAVDSAIIEARPAGVRENDCGVMPTCTTTQATPGSAQGHVDPVAVGAGQSHQAAEMTSSTKVAASSTVTTKQQQQQQQQPMPDDSTHHVTENTETAPVAATSESHERASNSLPICSFASSEWSVEDGNEPGTKSGGNNHSSTTESCDIPNEPSPGSSCGGEEDGGSNDDGPVGGGHNEVDDDDDYDVVDHGECPVDFEVGTVEPKGINITARVCGVGVGSRVLSVAFNPTGTTAVYGLSRGFVLVDTGTFDVTHQVALEGGVGIAEVLHETKLVAAVGGGSLPFSAVNRVTLFDTSGAPRSAFSCHDVVLAVRLGSDRIVVALPRVVEIWSFRGERLTSFDTAIGGGGAGVVHDADELRRSVVPLAISFRTPTCALCFRGSVNSAVTVVNWHTATAVASLDTGHKSPVGALGVNSDGTRVASCSTSGTVVKIFDVASGAAVCEVRRGTTPKTILSLLFCGDYFLSLTTTPTLKIFSSVKHSCGPSYAGRPSEQQQANNTGSFLAPLSFASAFFSSEWRCAEASLGDLLVTEGATHGQSGSGNPSGSTSPTPAVGQEPNDNSSKDQEDGASKGVAAAFGLATVFGSWTDRSGTASSPSPSHQDPRSTRDLLSSTAGALLGQRLALHPDTPLAMRFFRGTQQQNHTMYVRILSPALVGGAATFSFDAVAGSVELV